jgi:VWFA-related protein
MLWRVVKPNLGPADKPSASTRLLGRKVPFILAAAWVALCRTPATAGCGPASGAAPVHLTGPSAATIGSESQAVARSAVPGYTIRRLASEVRLQFSVTDEQQHLVNGLSSGDFRIFDDQVAVQRFRNFSRLENLPLQIGLLLDVSDSVHKTVSREKLAAQYFVRQVLRPETDRAFLLEFSQDIKLRQPFTGNPDALQLALEGAHELGDSTNLYDGLFYACLNQFTSSALNGAVQRIVVLFSDGEDTGSLHSLADTIAVAQRREIRIYALSVRPPRQYSTGDAILRQLAEQTGGQFYIVASDKDLSAVFASMDQQMRSQYYVSFRPERKTPGFHELRLEMTNPGKLRIHARQGYYYDAR